MELDSVNSWEAIREMKKNYQELKSQIQAGVNQDPDYQGEAAELLDSIDNLLEEIDSIKTPKDLTPKKQLKINAFSFWLNFILFQDEDEFEGEDGEEDDDFFLASLFGEDFLDEEDEDGAIDIKPAMVKKLPAGNQNGKKRPVGNQKAVGNKKIEKKAPPAKKAPPVKKKPKTGK